jgi:hypothetical protein
MFTLDEMGMAVSNSVTTARYGMATSDIKQEAHRLVDSLPEDATWEDLMYEIYVFKAVKAGIEASQAGRKMDVKEVRARLGLPE